MSSEPLTIRWDANTTAYTFTPKAGVTLTRIGNGKVQLSTTNPEDKKWEGTYGIYFKKNDHNSFVGFYNETMSGICTPSGYTLNCNPMCEERWLPQDIYDKKFKIISREEWGALPPKSGVDYPDVQSTDLSAYYYSIVIHHTGNANNAITPIELQQKEMDAGYADIPYHFLIDINGNIYEGRPITKEQAHVKGVHHGLIGIALLADLDTENDGLSWWKKQIELFHGDGDLTDPMLYSLLSLSKHLKIKYGINDLGGHKEYHTVLNPDMDNSGDGRICPGNLGMSAVNFLRRVLNLPPPK